jgi:hypothetical protein
MMLTGIALGELFGYTLLQVIGWHRLIIATQDLRPNPPARVMNADHSLD